MSLKREQQQEEVHNELLLLRQHFRETWRPDDFASLLADAVANRDTTVEEALRRLNAAPARRLAVRLGVVPESWFLDLEESLRELAR